MFASPMAINVTSYKLVYWSYNGTSETNITVIGPLLLWDLKEGPFTQIIWKLEATTATIDLTSHSGNSVIKGLQTCVQHPLALLVGSINIPKNKTIFGISCSNCNITSCVDNYNNGTLLTVKHSSYILVPSNFMGPWHHDRGLQVVKEIKTLLVKKKRFVGLMIAGIIAAITPLPP
jgi:hypothetical protein